MSPLQYEFRECARSCSSMLNRAGYQSSEGAGSHHFRSAEMICSVQALYQALSIFRFLCMWVFRPKRKTRAHRSWVLFSKSVHRAVVAKCPRMRHASHRSFRCFLSSPPSYVIAPRCEHSTSTRRVSTQSRGARATHGSSHLFRTMDK